MQVSLQKLGLVDYKSTWELQKHLQRELIDGSGQETLIICRHPAVITLGRSTKAGNLLVNADALSRQNLDVFEVERGGDITFHSPEQVIAYPILNLKNYKTDVNWFMRALEEVVIQSMTHFDLEGVRISGRTGVWVPNSRKHKTTAKIAAQGVRLSRWCSLHGLALNVLDCQYGFKLINPCGFNDIRVTSLAEESINASIHEVENLVIEKFRSVFGFEYA